MPRIDQLPPDDVIVTGASCGLAAGACTLQLVEAELCTTAGIEFAIEAIQDALSSRELAALTLMAVAPARLAGALADRMAPGGRVLNLSTSSAHVTFHGLSPYFMSRHALHSVSRSLQLELPATIAVAVAFIAWVLTGTAADAFAREEPWFIYDPTTQPQWLPEGVVFDCPEP